MEEKLNFYKTARQVYNQIRGLNSWPGAYCIFEGKILKVSEKDYKKICAEYLMWKGNRL